MTPHTSNKSFTVSSVVLFITLAIYTFIVFDHAMRVDQQNLCGKLPDIECPTGLWIWSPL